MKYTILNGGHSTPLCMVSSDYDQVLRWAKDLLIKAEKDDMLHTYSLVIYKMEPQTAVYPKSHPLEIVEESVVGCDDW